MPETIVRKLGPEPFPGTVGLTSKCQSWGQVIGNENVAMIRMRMLAIMLSIPLIASTATAQVKPDPPEGSYRQSCKEIHTAGDPRNPASTTVYAQCKTEAWGYEYTQIDLKRCEPNADGRIKLTNRNGDLLCEGPYPPGSYLRSCQDGLVIDKTLSAVCEDKEGHWHHTSVPLAGCSIGFTNSNGRLLCGR
jgi:CVNH domain